MRFEAYTQIPELGIKNKIRILIRTLLRHTKLIGETQRKGHYLLHLAMAMKWFRQSCGIGEEEFRMNWREKDL